MFSQLKLFFIAMICTRRQLTNMSVSFLQHSSESQLPQPWQQEESAAPWHAAAGLGWPRQLGEVADSPHSRSCLTPR